jgi:hypothetical protein
MNTRLLIPVFTISLLFSTSIVFGESSDESQYFFKVGDLFYWQNLQTGETIPPSGVLISILVSSLGPILIVLFIVIYAIKKRRKKKAEEKK